MTGVVIACAANAAVDRGISAGISIAIELLDLDPVGGRGDTIEAAANFWINCIGMMQRSANNGIGIAALANEVLTKEVSGDRLGREEHYLMWTHTQNVER